MTKTIQEIAQDYADRFEQRTREDKSEFWTVKDDQKSEELTELIHTAHGDMAPDDFRYAFIVDSLVAIAESSNAEEATLEADIYTHELTSWLASRADRYSYCDEYVADFGTDSQEGKFMGTIELLQGGQWKEKNEVLDSVRQSLLNILENEEE